MEKQDNEIHVTLGIIQNNMSHMDGKFSKLEKSVDTGLASVKDAINKLAETFKSDYVTRQEFAPVRLIVYGLVSIVLIGVFTALIALVLRQ